MHEGLTDDDFLVAADVQAACGLADAAAGEVVAGGVGVGSGFYLTDSRHVKDEAQPNFNTYSPIFFCPSCSYVLKICA